MKSGNISNAPAPFILVDGVSLFEAKLFSKKIVNRKYVQKLLRVAGAVNIEVFVERGKFSVKDLDILPYPFSSYIEKNLRGMTWYLFTKKLRIFASGKRLSKFAGRGIDLAISVDSIVSEGKYV